MRLKLIPILPRRRNLYDIPAGHAAKEEALYELAEEAVQLLELSVATWEFEPVFHVRYTSNSATVFTRDKIFGYVNAGTRSHRIEARRGPGPLSFTVGGRSKTRPRVISSTLGSQGNIWVSTYTVEHPGIEAREFTVVVQERIQRKFPAKFRAVLAAYQTGEAPGL